MHLVIFQDIYQLTRSIIKKKKKNFDTLTLEFKPKFFFLLNACLDCRFQLTFASNLVSKETFPSLLLCWGCLILHATATSPTIQTCSESIYVLALIFTILVSSLQYYDEFRYYHCHILSTNKPRMGIANLQLVQTRYTKKWTLTKKNTNKTAH